MKSMNRLNVIGVSTLIVALFVSSCGPKKVSGRTGKARGLVTMPDGTEVSISETRGGFQATFDPNSTEPQIMNIGSGTLSGVSIAFPVGALSIPITITVTPGTAVNGTAMMTNLGLNNRVASSGTPIEISPSAAVDLSNPMVLSIPLPRSTGLVADTLDRSRLAILYKVKVAQGSDTGSFTGIVPAKDLGFSGENVLFETKYFGWFSVVTMEEPVTAAIKTKAVYADQLSAKFFTTLAELPACTTADLYRIAYVSAENTMYYCGDKQTWVKIVEPTLPDDDDELNDAEANRF